MTLARFSPDPTFHISGLADCPYLHGRQERRLFVDIARPDAQELFENLSQSGFRRSRHLAYRPICPDCDRCLPVRVDVAGFRAGRSFRRICRRNSDLVMADAGLQADAEHYALFRRYVRARHGGEMAQMDFDDYRHLVLDSPVATTMFEWRDEAGRLWAACLTDCLNDGLSAVYSYFEPAAARRSLGSFVILSLLARARAFGLSHLYLGFLVPGNPGMSYKWRFRPLQVCGPAGWRTLAAIPAQDC